MAKYFTRDEIITAIEQIITEQFDSDDDCVVFEKLFAKTSAARPGLSEHEPKPIVVERILGVHHDLELGATFYVVVAGTETKLVRSQ